MISCHHWLTAFLLFLVLTNLTNYLSDQGRTQGPPATPGHPPESPLQTESCSYTHALVLCTVSVRCTLFKWRDKRIMSRLSFSKPKCNKMSVGSWAWTQEHRICQANSEYFWHNVITKKCLWDRRKHVTWREAWSWAVNGDNEFVFKIRTHQQANTT